MLYRRFAYIQSRLLLRKQEELRELEGRLYLLDRDIAKWNPVLMQSHQKNVAKSREHTILLDTMEEKYKANGSYQAPFHAMD